MVLIIYTLVNDQFEMGDGSHGCAASASGIFVWREREKITTKTTDDDWKIPQFCENAKNNANEMRLAGYDYYQYIVA